MQKLIKTLGVAMFGFFLSAMVAYAAVFIVPQGGTGAGTLTGILQGNGTSAVTGITASSGIAGAISDETGSGSLVFATSPTLVTPTLGVATATSINGTAIPTSKTLVVTTDKLSVLASTSSAELGGVISDETGSGALVFANSPIFTTPNIGSATGSITGNAGTATALAVNPSDCSSNQFANAIAASGDLTCGALADADIPNILTLSKISNLTSNGFVKTSAGDGTLSIDTNTYLTGNQSITLSGDVSGSGSTAITTAIGSDKITEAMLKAVDASSDEECLTYESTVGDFEWQSCGGAGVSDGDKGEIVVSSSGAVWNIDTAATPQVTKLGIGAAADASRLLLVTGDVSGGVATINRSNASTNGAVGTVIIKGTSTGDMVDGFGAAFQFAIQDTAAVENLIGAIRGLRDGSDTSGKIDFTTYRSGVSSVVAAFRADGSFQLTPPVTTSGSPVNFLMTGAAHTTLTAGAESPDVNFNLNRTVQFATGAITSASAFKINAPTYGFVGASTITNAATLYIDDNIDAGTNATITNSYSIWVDDGLARFDGGIVSGNSQYYKMFNSSGTAISLMGVNGVDDVHYLADITSGIDEVWVGYNSPLNFTFGGSCCGGNLPLAWVFNSQNGATWKTDDSERFKVDDDSVNVSEHLVSTDTAPSLSSCGTTPSITASATDNAGKVTMGTGGPTSCTVTFGGGSWTNAPACTVTGDQTSVNYRATTTTTTLVITSSADMSSDVVMYVCIGTE